MKNKAKFFIAGAVLLIAGVIIFVISMSVLEWNFTRLDTATYEAKSYTVNDESEQITTVSIDVDSFPVYINPGYKLSVNYYEASYSKVSVVVENGVLKITEKRDKNFFKSGLFNFGALSHKYEVIVPDGINIEFNGTNGDITLYGLSTESVSIKSTNANLKMDICTLKTLNFDSTNADITLKNCRIADVNLNSTNLDFNAEYCTIDELTANGTNCDFVMQGGSCTALQVTSTNNDVEIKEVSVSKLTIKGTNLDAELTIRGVKSEYTILTNGKNLPAPQTGTTDKVISISGTNNDVELKFV